ncbi:MAG: hypothetical protein AAB538_01005 [Patescibacteria group bacterium]
MTEYGRNGQGIINFLDRMTSGSSCVGFWDWHGGKAMGIRTVTVAESWPAHSRQRARALVAEYGVPQNESSDYLEWDRVEEWQRVRVRRDGLIEETVPYAVPGERLEKIRAFGGRLFIDMWHQEVTVTGESEEVNRLLLNLMHDILVGAKTPGQAWEKYEWSQRALSWHWPDPYLTHLHFHTDTQQLHVSERRWWKAPALSETGESHYSR